MLGVRGQLPLGAGNWILPFHADVGSGDASLTWQLMLGASYRWSWGDTGITYRHLTYDMAGNGLLQDIEISGPTIFITGRF